LTPPEKLYLDLLERSLTDALDPSADAPKAPAKFQGTGWPAHAPTMVGEARLRNVRRCVENVLSADVPGDLIEAGVWRGGVTILMRGILAAHRVTDRSVWVADSFRGLPPPDPERYPADKDDELHREAPLAVSVDEVRENFSRYGLLDDQVRFLEGWFRETLPTVRDRTWAVVRLDGDMYESTMDGLRNLYPGLAVGGYLIVDDYALPACAEAVHDYRESEGIGDEIERIDWTGVFWQRRE
jgi:O-methyltransferase